MRPVARLVNERHRVPAPPAEDDGRDRHASTVLGFRGEHGVVGHGRGETAVGMRGLGAEVGRPAVALPIGAFGGNRAVLALPPHVAVVEGGDVRVDRVVGDGGHRVGIGLGVGAGDDAEISALRVDRPQPAVRAGLHPGDVVADGADFPPGVVRGRDEHGEIRLAARARERGGDVVFLARRRFGGKQQHVLGHPTLIAREVAAHAQGETFLAQQHVAAVAAADGQNLVVLREMADESPRRVQVEHRMQAAVEVAAVARGQVIQRHRAHARDLAQVEHDVDRIRDLHAHLRQRRPRRSHQVRHHEHRPPAHGPGEQAAQFFAGGGGSDQLLVGPASSSVGVQMKVSCSTRATSLGLERWA